MNKDMEVEKQAFKKILQVRVPICQCQWWPLESKSLHALPKILLGQQEGQTKQQKTSTITLLENREYSTPKIFIK